MIGWLKERYDLMDEVASLKASMQGMEYAKTLERFHNLDGLKDNLCPCCGGAVNVVDNGHGHGVKIESRW